DRSPLVYNQADTYMPDLLICRTEWAQKVLAEVAKLS
ncbi:MAG: 3'(2'),5'-bisphosphate nucleotidase CysQ, partial [Alphaproteobacteria bacterium HGW-Alphaproteobacteria-15]